MKISKLCQFILIAGMFFAPNTSAVGQSSDTAEVITPLSTEDEDVWNAIKNLNGTGGPELELLESMADKGNAMAIVAVASLYENGRVFESKTYSWDGEKANQLYMSAAKIGNARALYKSAMLFLSGDGGYKYCCETEKDAEKVAIEYLQKAYGYTKWQANLDTPSENTFAMIRVALGDAYSDGIGVDADPVQAAMYFREAVDSNTHPKSNLPDAYTKLAQMYVLGDGVTEDKHEAARLYLECAEMENAECLYFAGMVFGAGFGGYEKDPAKARQYLEAAKQKGNDDAAKILENDTP